MTVTQTVPPCTWELDHPNAADGDHRRILKAAEHAVLRVGGDRLAVTCAPEQEELHDQLERWSASRISKADDRYTIELVAPAADGLIHDDFDFRTPHLPDLRGTHRRKPDERPPGRVQDQGNSPANLCAHPSDRRGLHTPCPD